MQKNNLLKNNYGLTLVEILVGMLIFSILMLTISTIMYPTLNSIYSTKKLSEYGIFVDNIATEISNEIKLSNKIELELSPKAEDISQKLILYNPENKISYTILGGILKCNYNDEKNDDGDPIYYDVVSSKYYDGNELEILYEPILRDKKIMGCKLKIKVKKAEEYVFEKDYSAVSFIV